MQGMKLAKVTRVVPGGYAVDLLFLDDGSRVPAVQVMASAASGNTGLVDLAQPDQSADQWDPNVQGEREMIACVSFYRGLPVVMGFLFPQICQMLFDRQNFKVDRHSSDVYSTIDADGNTEVYHPSGTYLRIGTDPAHEDLTGQDFDGKWAIAKNADKAVHVQLTVKNAGVQKFSLNIDPAGNVTVDHAGNYTQNIGGNFTQNVTGSYTLSVGGTYAATAGGSYTLTSASYDWLQG